jgi:hypothetical protein
MKKNEMVSEIEKNNEDIKDLRKGCFYYKSKLLGSGAYAKVFLGKYNEIDVAIKVLGLHNINDIDKEIKLMKMVNSPYILKFYDFRVIFLLKFI